MTTIPGPASSSRQLWDVEDSRQHVDTSINVMDVQRLVLPRTNKTKSNTQPLYYV